MVMVWRVGGVGRTEGESAKEKAADNEKGVDYQTTVFIQMVSKAPNSSKGQGIKMYIAWGHKLWT